MAISFCGMWINEKQGFVSSLAEPVPPSISRHFYVFSPDFLQADTPEAIIWHAVQQASGRYKSLRCISHHIKALSDRHAPS
jgi:hypothetical protein